MMWVVQFILRLLLGLIVASLSSDFRSRSMPVGIKSRSFKVVKVLARIRRLPVEELQKVVEGCCNE